MNMSLRNEFETINAGKAFGYSLAGGGILLTAVDLFRLASGDLTGLASIGSNLLSYAGAVAGGLSFAFQANSVQAQTATVKNRSYTPILIMPKNGLIHS